MSSRRPKRHTPLASCIIPAFNEEKAIGDVIDVIKKVPEIQEIIVVDDGSTDRTSQIAKEKGTRVVRHEMQLGKGAAMKTGARKAKSDLLVFIDADLENLTPAKVRKLINPLLQDEADFVKASYDNPSGRTTKLVAKPLLKIVYPFIKLKYPLSGEIALNRKKFKFDNIEDGWGVDIQLVIQAAKRKLRTKEVFLGKKEHKHQDIDALSQQAEQVMRTILSELKLIANKRKLVFFDFDQTLIQESSASVFAKKWDFTEEFEELKAKRDRGEIPDKEITKALARHFKDKTQEDIRAICEEIEISPFAKKVIAQLRRQRFRVRIISSAFSPVVQHFAALLNVYDFVCPRLQRGKDKRFTGELLASRFEDKNCSCCGMYVCKKKAVDFVRRKFGWKRDECMAIGDGKSDECMFAACGLSLGYNTDKGTIRIENMSDVLMYID